MSDEQSCLPLRNPYLSLEHLHKIQGHVSTADFRYFRERFPLAHGVVSTIVSHYFKYVVSELKRIDAEQRAAGEPGIEPAWSAVHPNNSLLRQILERSTVGGTPVRPERGTGSGGRDVGGTVGDLCPTIEPAKTIQSNLQSSTSERRHETRGEAQDQNGTVVGPGPAGADQTTEIPDALKLLRDLDILP